MSYVEFFKRATRTDEHPDRLKPFREAGRPGRRDTAEAGVPSSDAGADAP